jgi:hypothetical protein
MDIQGLLPPNTFNTLSSIYAISVAENGSLRTGCIGCPLVKKDKSLEYFIVNNVDYSPLAEVKSIYSTLVLDEHRLLRKSSRVDRLVNGGIKLASRYICYLKLLDIESRVRLNVPGFVLIEDYEKQAIQEAQTSLTYTRLYRPEDLQVIIDVSNFKQIFHGYPLDDGRGSGR